MVVSQQLLRQKRILALASAGGHWVQLQRITPAFAGWDIAYASTDPLYAEEIPGQRYYTISDANRFTRHRVFVAALQIYWIIRREHPDLIITTGAAPGLIALLLGRLVFHRRTIWIDSMVNVDQLSTSGRWAGRFADLWLTQWQHLAEADGPLFSLLGPGAMIFVTIGCALPFDRLITAMDFWAACHPETGIFAQIGAAAHTPRHMPHRRLLSPAQYRAQATQSRLIVAHAGMGSIITACQLGKPIVLLPRRAQAREHTTDHQLATARRFRHVPGIFVADDIAELAPQIAAAEAYGPAPQRLSPHAPTAFTDRLRAAILELCP